MEKLKVESLVSAEIRVSNTDNESRAYDISAVVRVDGGNVTNVSQGRISAKNSEQNASSFATFDSWSMETLNIQYQTKDSRDAILTNIELFINKCRSDKEITTAAIND